jgi:DinB superfamily
MNSPLTLLPVAALALTCALQAQNPLSTEAKQAYTGVKNNLTRAAEKMPADAYDFKASPDIRTFGALIGHIADSQMGTCSAVNGEMKQGGASSKTKKDELVAALKSSFEECDKAFDALTDASAGSMVKTRRGERTKLGTLVGVTTHDNEEYGYLAVYMRLKGIVPPSSDRSR